MGEKENLLESPAPSRVLIGDKEYSLNTSFHIGIEVERMLDDDMLSSAEKIERILYLYLGCIPDDVEDAVEKVIWFYKGGRERQTTRSEASTSSPERYMSFYYDAEYIYAAIMQQYGIDLQNNDVHWWVFRALIAGLTDQTEFIKIVQCRAVKITPRMSREQKEYFQKMKDLHRLPMKKAEADQHNMIVEALMNGGDLRGISNRYYAEQEKEDPVSKLRK